MVIVFLKYFATDCSKNKHEVILYRIAHCSTLNTLVMNSMTSLRSQMSDNYTFHSFENKKIRNFIFKFYSEFISKLRANYPSLKILLLPFSA